MAKKLFYKIGEACRLVDIQPYVLRYWETEFPFLQPEKSKSGQRVYSERELAIVRRIKQLLYDEGYTIAGAKKKLESELDEAGESRPVLALVELPPLPEPDDEPAAQPELSPPQELDSSAQKLRIFRAGIVGALTEAREILRLLDQGASPEARDTRA